MPKKKQKKKRNARAARAALLAVLCLLVLLTGWMYINAHIVHLRRETVALNDLPAMFDGVKLVFISDMNVMTDIDARGMEGVFEKLSSADAQMLILGGDYSTTSLVTRLGGGDGRAAEERAARAIRKLTDLNMPLGKFAVGGEEDENSEIVKAALKEAGFTLLGDTSGVLTLGGAEIRIAGLSTGSAMANHDRLARGISSKECTIVVAHDPAAYAGIRVAEAKDGGDWADLVLSGHTLGGQIVVAGHGIREAKQSDIRAGWYNKNDVPLLISSGIGCKDVPLRLETQSEIHLIELKKKQ